MVAIRNRGVLPGGGTLPPDNVLTWRWVLVLIMAALGIGRLSIVLGELGIQSILTAWPQFFDGLTVLDQSGQVDREGSLQLAFWLKEILYSLVAIGFCLCLKGPISLFPKINLRVLKNVAIAAIAGVIGGLCIRKGTTLLDPALPQAQELALWGASLLGISYLVRICILAPLEEEFIFRGLVPHYAKGGTGWKIALLSILPWAFEHVTTGGVWQVTISLIMGPIYYAVRHYTGHFFYAVVAHSLFNLIQIMPWRWF